MNDSIDEFAERVAGTWFNSPAGQSSWSVSSAPELAALIAHNLRAGGWYTDVRYSSVIPDDNGHLSH